MEFYMNAFFELPTERREAGTPIPWSAIRTYAREYGHNPDHFLRVLRSMDLRYIDHVRNKSEG